MKLTKNKTKVNFTQPFLCTSNKKNRTTKTERKKMEQANKKEMKNINENVTPSTINSFFSYITQSPQM